VSAADLGFAEKKLHDSRLTLVVVKNQKPILTSKTRGVSGFLEAIDRLGERFEDATVADKVVGRAIALLCAYSKVKAVYAETLSQSAKSFLEKNEITLKWKVLVVRILNAEKTETCPFEKIVEKMSNPAVAYNMLTQACSMKRISKT
jgi:hypothetical protein